jgi:pyruvate/2-oxoglutarate/acetoin dehydrogenase E1 component
MVKTQTQHHYVDAVNAALLRVLEEVPNTIVFGEDVGEPGGVFGATRGLRERFGERVFDTPISESAILGAAIGAAMMGMRPIAEIMWVDFMLVALDQVVNQAANVRYVSNGRLTAPLTIRTQQGALPGSCAQHSQNLEALFAHVPGLLVGLPATVQDAYDMLVAAVYNDNPTLVIENRGLYRRFKEEALFEGAVQPVGGSRVRRVGSDVTLVTWGAMTYTALEAADMLAREVVGVEVLDLRWLVPFDTETLAASLEKTGRLVVAHEANVFGGFGAEVAAWAAENFLYSLEAPVRRVGVPNCRIPAAPHLQAALIPDATRIARAVRETLE